MTTVSYYATLGATVLAAVLAPKASSSSRSSSASSKTATTTTTTTSKKGNGQGQTQKQRMLPLLVDGKVLAGAVIYVPLHTGQAPLELC